MTYRTGKFLESTAKSILGLVDIYNLLPQEIVSSEDVHTFQAKLQSMMKQMVNAGQRNWETIFSPRHALHMHLLLSILNKVVTIGTIQTEVGTSIDTCERFWEEDDNDENMSDDRPPSWW